jgi:hypothetical protein
MIRRSGWCNWAELPMGRRAKDIERHLKKEHEHGPSLSPRAATL